MSDKELDSAEALEKWVNELIQKEYGSGVAHEIVERVTLAERKRCADICRAEATFLMGKHDETPEGHFDWVLHSQYNLACLLATRVMAAPKQNKEPS